MTLISLEIWLNLLPLNRIVKINFQGKQTNFWLCRNGSKKYKISDGLVLFNALEQNVLNEKNRELLKKFIHFIEKKTNLEISSQLYQDMFAEFILEQNTSKIFIEFGATDGFNLSNTYTLEKYFGWKGLLVEPDPQWHPNLKLNRPYSKKIYDCVWIKSNETINFLTSQDGNLSTIENFRNSDEKMMSANSIKRNQNSKIIQLKTISLNDLVKNHLDDSKPSYISIDTEGSEYDILSNFDFTKYGPEVFTVEHNHSELEKKIDELMNFNNYLRVFNTLTAFDAWYVAKKTLTNI